MKGASIEEGDANQNMDEVEDVNAEEDTNEKKDEDEMSRFDCFDDTDGASDGDEESNHTCSVTARSNRARQATHAILGQIYKESVGGVRAGVQPVHVADALNLCYGIKVKLNRKALHLSRLEVDVLDRFKYVFIAFGASIDGFPFIRKVIVVDEIFLKGKYLVLGVRPKPIKPNRVTPNFWLSAQIEERRQNRTEKLILAIRCRLGSVRYSNRSEIQATIKEMMHSHDDLHVHGINPSSRHMFYPCRRRSDVGSNVEHHCRRHVLMSSFS
ncbi:putative transposon protein [Arabidopsis thaliana]|uniref:Putative transposon protein n=1 Tax=Arabidopsis thaliana TaxID=3702 RepID=Q9M104_ARATH|nr:putative transposon protein [Arabidopsis thaliana]